MRGILDSFRRSDMSGIPHLMGKGAGAKTRQMRLAGPA